MNKTKKSLLALLLTSMVTIGLAGCSQSADSTTPATTKENVVPNLQLNNNQATADKTKTDDKTKQDQSSSLDPHASEPVIQEVRKAFNIGNEYVTVTMPAISGIALGKFEQITVDQNQRLALARALTSAMINSGWEQGAPDPAMFVASDGSTFMVGMKKKSGDFSLETYQLQSDKTYKSVKKESKPAGK
ncbi:MAG: hypothetical protein ACXVDE_05395 [Tumebacillaceae bacterium]